MFQKATKSQLKARVALDGPSGSGKTWTALLWAEQLGKRTAVIDTERGSASLYSDRFEFDTVRVAPPYDPSRLVEILKDAEHEGYDTVVVDSLSHYWEGEGGTLDIADAAGQRAQGNSWAGWKVATPALRHLVDVMLGLDAHLIVTMRSKTEWTLEEYSDSKGKTRTRPVRVGMAPVMRAGIEYEFTVVGDLDMDHRMSVSKTRCAILADRLIQPDRSAEVAEEFLGWLNSGDKLASRVEVATLRAAMDAVESSEQRKLLKLAFKDRFGMPEELLADRVEEATTFVEEWGVDPEGDDDEAGDR